MMKKSFVGLLTAAFMVLGGGAALAQGAYPNSPIMGGPSYCSSLVNGSCVSTVPAGPAVSGNELVPVDTRLSQGRYPQQALMTLADLGALPMQYAVATAGQSITVAATTGKMVLDPAGTLATLTLVLPAATALRDGQVLEIGSSQTITALTITPGSGTTIAQNPTALTVSTTAPYGYKFIYSATAAKWIRMQ